MDYEYLKGVYLEKSILSKQSQVK